MSQQRELHPLTVIVALIAPIVAAAIDSSLMVPTLIVLVICAFLVGFK